MLKVKIALVADTNQPGRSGVGDYTLVLASKLQSMGISAEVFPLDGPASDQRNKLPGQLSAFQPDWVSFQFVPYAFAHRGLVTRRTLPWESLRGTRGTQFRIFHEIWVGANRGAPLRDRAIGLLQRRGIRSVMRTLKPSVVHCSNRLYSNLLTHAGITNEILPLFGNIPVLPAKVDPYVEVIASMHPGGDRKGWTVAAFFGTIHSNSSAPKVLRWLQETAQRHGRRLLVVSLGRCPAAEQHFRDWSEILHETGRVDFLVKGEMPPDELSAWLGAADCGVTTTPYNIIGKSSSAIAFAEHGVPVMVTDRGLPVRYGDLAAVDRSPRFWLAEESVLKTLQDVPPRQTGGSGGRWCCRDILESSGSGMSVPHHEAIRTLLCHRDVDLAIHCLGSAVQMSADPVRVVIHEDGSLTTGDREKIEARLPGARIMDRREADAIMAEKLASHSNARSFREGSVWGLKLLDVVLAEPGLCFYLDGDIRFFRPFRGLFADAAVRERCVFLRDTVWQAYSVRPWHLLDARGLNVASGINTGLTLCDPAIFDLDFVDWFLAQPDWRVIPAWTEPTCWAALALRGNGHGVIPEQLTNLYPSARITARTIAGHFLSAHRAQWGGRNWMPRRSRNWSRRTWSLSG